jgi:hypothetical protein
VPPDELGNRGRYSARRCADADAASARIHGPAEHRNDARLSTGSISSSRLALAEVTRYTSLWS